MTARLGKGEEAPSPTGPALARIAVLVQPRASRNQFSLGPDGQIKVALTAPPVEGEANKMLCAVVADKLGVAKSNVKVIAGQRGRRKIVEIRGLSNREVSNILDILLKD